MKTENYNTITTKQNLYAVVSYLDNYLKRQTNGKVYAFLTVKETNHSTNSSESINYDLEYAFQIRENDKWTLLVGFTSKLMLMAITPNEVELFYSKKVAFNKKLSEVILTYMILGKVSNEDHWAIEELTMMSIPDIINKYKN